MKTTAAVSTGPAQPFTFQDLELDDPRPDEILVRVEAVGLCHTDLAMKGMFPDGVAAVLGHEGAGVVERVGSDVADVRPGDKVIMSYASCGACERCTSGHPAYCALFQQLNASGARTDGSPTLTGPSGPVVGSFFGQSSFARYAVTARRNAVVVDPAVDLTLAASFGCGIQTGAGAVVNVLKPGPDSRLAVFGLGGVGMAAIMAAANLDVGQIIGVDLSGSRRATALRAGATHVLDGADPGLLTVLRELTGGGATHAFDSTAVPAVIRTAAQGLTSLGTLVVVGIGPDVTLDVGDLMSGGKTVRGCIEGDADPQTFIPQLVEWHLKDRFPMEEIVRTFPFSEINEAVAQAKDGSAIKPVLIMDSGATTWH
ncbi:NAD(P)-dependent alcohol dehydrogenase [Actinoplanes sp. NPDC026619]|uniref:NAD(P)-dependent alcohol dehydrogenase n=1 Tax=Actinoplanes sp. NPDC026619 TaxID=3155798 RepID=UPI0033C7EC01